MKQQRPVNHLASISEGASAIVLSLLKLFHQSPGPLDFRRRRAERFVDRPNLARMYQLFSAETERLALVGLLTQAFLIFKVNIHTESVHKFKNLDPTKKTSNTLKSPPVNGVDGVQIERVAYGGDLLPRVQQSRDISLYAHIGAEVVTAENASGMHDIGGQTLEPFRELADVHEVQQTLCSFNMKATEGSAQIARGTLSYRTHRGIQFVHVICRIYS